MSTIQISFIAFAIIVAFLWILSARFFKKREEAARQAWRASRMRLNRFISNPLHSLDSPKGQWYLQAEVGAYMILLERKRIILPEDLEYYKKRLDLVDADCGVEEPYEN